MGKGENEEGRGRTRKGGENGGKEERRRRISYYCYYIAFGDEHQS